MEKEIFKVGDRVFDYRYGWGQVTRYIHDISCPIQVTYDESMGGVEYYTNEGYDLKNDLHPTLSFTEYTLEGFSLERPSKFKEGDVCVMVHKAGYFERLIYRPLLAESEAKLLTMEEFKEYINENY